VDIFSFFTSAVGGTVLGGATQLLGTLAGEAKEWSASRRRIAELQALKEKEIAIGELEAFTKAQEGTMPSNYQPPANAPMAMHWVFTLVEAATRLVRPAMVAGACAYVWSRPPEAIAGLQAELLTFSFACGYFWLGTRLQRQLASK
jgi:hypothetical protein